MFGLEFFTSFIFRERSGCKKKVMIWKSIWYLDEKMDENVVVMFIYLFFLVYEMQSCSVNMIYFVERRNSYDFLRAL